MQSSSEVWSVSEREDEEVVSVGGSASQSFELLEDTSFWKDHNVQVSNQNIIYIYIVFKKMEEEGIT